MEDKHAQLKGSLKMFSEGIKGITGGIEEAFQSLAKNLTPEQAKEVAAEMKKHNLHEKVGEFKKTMNDFSKTYTGK